jgi:hypothetical protein
MPTSLFKWCTGILQIVHRLSAALDLIFEPLAGTRRCDHTSHHQCLGPYPLTPIQHKSLDCLPLAAL